MRSTIHRFAGTVIAGITILTLTAQPSLSAAQVKTTINGDENIVADGNVTVYRGLSPKQLAEYRKSIQHQDWEATKENPAFRKLVRAAHGGKEVEQLDAYSRAKFWEDLSNFLDKVVQADADAQKLFQQGSVGAELKALIPKIEAARDNFNYDEVNRLLAEFRNKHNDLQQDLAKVHYLQGQTYELQINYPEAERYYKKAAAIEDENPLYLNTHAGILWKMGRYAEAEPLFRRALSIGEKTLGPEYPDVAASLNNLAVLLSDQGNYTEAEPLFRRAFAIREKVLGPNHPDVATDLNNLALLLKTQGKYDEAGLLFRRALAMNEKALGPNHPDVATNLNNLALLLSDQEKYAEAEPLYRRALAIDEKALSSNHPDVATDLNNLALLLSDQEKYAEAEPLYRRALVIDEKALGSNHPNVATRLNNLASLLYGQGKYDDAEPLFRRALVIDEKALGPNHPTTVLYRNNLNALLAKKKQ
ncbi:tetratricopeptide repeat protein [Chlorobaculum sp. 24CR]|uniref:tetratricopeptide repeat protein n=1 Tax=Chlorobaculum sp. 24CR TaxID=2508878 RepID=UPI00100AA820|nr:tetratricopeptide repeat protein [Chlorobaculum sp. 24CR]RXK82136.1 tetratricopeptide repeat protein [Chlorobaculum sp. 24CR]